MLIIRLQRVGKRKFPTYRLIVSEKARDTKGTYLEALGTFNPHVKENGFKPITERIKYWLSKGAQTSGTLNNLFIAQGLIEGKKMKSVCLSERRKKKLAEKSKAKAEAAAKAAPAPAVEEKKVEEKKEEAAPAVTEKPVVEEKKEEPVAPPAA